jgi:prepilin signal peptidase PulO-like enzyme (type II secretory pathway)
VAHWLRDRGFEAYAVIGGVGALDGRVASVEVASGPKPRERRGDALAALRHPAFRRFAAGSLLSLTGNWVEAASFGYVVPLLGGSPATLGLIGFLNTIPNLALGLPAGALADHFDRRKLLLVFQAANMGVAAALAVLWATGTLTVFLMGLLALAGGSLGTLSFPAFQSILSSTVPEEDLESAVALNSLSLQLARFVGPALAGFLLARGGPTWVFSVNAGSFVAVVAHRVPRGASIVGPRSRCPGCGTQIAAYDNVPLVSWLVLRGRGRCCGERISLRYPLTELALGALFAAVALHLRDDPAELAMGLIFTATLVAVTLTDLERRVIPNAILAAGAVALLIVAALSR